MRCIDECEYVINSMSVCMIDYNTIIYYTTAIYTPVSKNLGLETQ